MKKFVSLLLCSVLLIGMASNVFAAPANEGSIIFLEETVTEDGLTVIDKVVVYPQLSKANTLTADRIKTIYSGDTLIGEIAFVATFGYTGSSVSVISKEVTQTDTYEGWSYKQNSFTSSGGTVTLDAKLTKLLFFNAPFTMTLTCDVNGNISLA